MALIALIALIACAPWVQRELEPTCRMQDLVASTASPEICFHLLTPNSAV